MASSDAVVAGDTRVDVAVVHETASRTHDAGADRSTTANVLSLPPPPAYDLLIRDLSIGIPPPRRLLPLPIPIPVPALFLGKRALANVDKTIIRNVNARCSSGEILAVIGGSGSGKSTLLSAVVGRLANLPIRTGDIEFPTAVSENDRVILNARQMKDKIAFMPQDDRLLPNLTVKETLKYAAALRLPVSVAATTRQAIIEDTLRELGLKDAADTVIGGFGALRKGISGGERRRLSIACILVSLPSVIVLDEPTSGLDAFSAYQLLLTLSELAKRNRTIVVSLHQPRSDAFHIFDRILLLSRGDVIYSGLRSRCLDWFAGLGLEPEHDVNPLDFLIDISSVEIGDDDKRDSSVARVERLARAWQESDPLSTIELKSSLLQPSADAPKAKGPASHRLSVSKLLNGNEENRALRRPGILSQTRTLSSRANKNTLRNYGQTLGFASQSIVIGVLLGASFYRLGETPTDIQSLKTVCYQHIPSYFYLSVVYGIYRYCNELVVFDREREDHLYGVIPWLISEVISNLSMNIGFTSLFALLLYFLCSFRTDDLAKHLFIFMAECSLVQLGSISFALLSASLVRTYAQAGLLANAISIFFVLTAGFIILRPPAYVNWLRFISVYWYGFRIIVIDQFKDRVFSCEGVTGIARNQCIGNQVLEGLLIPHGDQLSGYFGGLLGVFVGYNVLSGIILAVWKPGGVQHATSIETGHGKASVVASEMDLSRKSVDVDVKSLRLAWSRSGFGPIGAVEKEILQDVTFQCRAGQVTAILGPSGAGKSSLLQLLAGRPLNAGPFARFTAQGTVTFNGKPRGTDTRDLVSFVEQEDHAHLPALTVRETLRYAALLRLPRTMSKKTRYGRAEEVMRMLGLEACADSLVGGELLKGISGGEKRRLSLAVGMMADPAVLIVDEVTSGLDAATANNVMKALRQIADSGRTVIDIYQLIDNVMLLVKGGRIAYNGPREQVEAFFELENHKIPAHFNPADFLLDIGSVDQRAQHEKASRARVDSLVDFWNNYERKLESPTDVRKESPTLMDVEESRFIPIWIAGPVILHRMFRNMWRQQSVFWVRLQQTPLMGLIFLLFFQRLKRGPTGGQDRIGLIMQSVTPLPFVGLLNSVAIFPTDRDLFFHEHKSGASYSAASFLLASTIMDLPLQFGASVLFALVMNVGGGMNTSPRIFMEFTASAFALQSSGESVGIMFAAFTDSMGLNVSLVSSLLSVMMQYSGILSLSVPEWLAALAWGTTMKPASRILVINEAHGLRLNCPPETISSGECLIQTGEDMIALFGWKDLNTGKFVGIMMVVVVAYRLLAWIALVIRIRGW